jgi:hypothetical protein
MSYRTASDVKYREDVFFCDLPKGSCMARLSTDSLDPWRLVWGQPYIDSGTLAAAIESDLQRDSQPDYRTRFLLHDAAEAIRSSISWMPMTFS